jgi:polyisoprenoid-binding protein YceI
MLRTTAPLALFLAMLGPTGPAAAQDAGTPRSTTWQVDRAHSQVSFVVRHFFTPVRGTFDSVTVALEFDPDNPAAGSVEVRIPVASVNTRNERRDNDLRSENFFEAATHPDITFRSSAVRATGANTFAVAGTLTIKGVEKTVELPVTFLGRQEIPVRGGGTREVAGFEAVLTIDRGDFGVGTGDWVRTNVVGGEVKIEIAIEASRR